LGPVHRRRHSGAAELKTGIDLPDYDLKTLRERTIEAAAALSGPSRVLIFACDYGGAASRRRCSPALCRYGPAAV
jgi:hypothetical protein